MMPDAMFFTKLRVMLCGWRWKSHRRGSWLKARLRRLRQQVHRASRSMTLMSAPRCASPFTLEPLEARVLLAADLTGVIQSASLSNIALPTDTATVGVQVQNQGNQRANATTQVAVYASPNNTFDAGDTLLGTANTAALNAGQSRNVSVNLTIPNSFTSGSYFLLSRVDATNVIAEGTAGEANNVTARSAPFEVAWKFGTVPGRSGNTTLTLRDADGTNVTFSLTGPGLGEVIRDGANWDMKVTGTTETSAVQITTNGNGGGNNRVTLNDIHVFGPLGSLTALYTDLTGTLAIDGPVKTLIDGTRVIASGSIILSSVQGATVAVPSVDVLTILNSVTNAQFYIGTTLGQDGQPGGTGVNGDTYGLGSIRYFTVLGSMTSTTVRVGVNPVDGLYGNGNDTLIGGTASSIGRIFIYGSLSVDTRFIAGSFPTQYLLGSSFRPTEADIHFVSNFSGPTLSAALQQDTGNSATDKLTNNPAVTGSVTDPNGIATFFAGFGTTPTFNVLADRQPNGSFTFTQTRLEQINGGALAEGPLTLTLRATDTTGNATQIALSFTLDRTAPATLTFDLAAASDTAPLNDQQTTNATVTLVGQSEANVLVELVALGLTTTADAAGAFSFSNVALTVGANSFTVRATDIVGNQRSDTRTITRVAVGNSAPMLNPIGTQTVNEGQQLLINVNATDPDGPTTFLFSLENGVSGQVPAGASIAGGTGQLTWTPTEAQGPGSYTFEVVVTDSGTPALSDRETITVTVTEVNQAPTLQAIPNQTATAGQLLTFTAVGADPDIPANSLAYSLDLSLLPPGFGTLNTPTIDPVSGVFTWTPAEGQVGTHLIKVRVSDNDAQSLFAQQDVYIAVATSNQAPVLNQIGNQSVSELQPLTFTASATDTDLPANSLTFSLTNAPVGASIDPTTGEFTWTPTEVQGPGMYTFDVVVSDGTLSYSETMTVAVGEVNRAPTLQAIPNKTVTAGQVLLFTTVGSDTDLPANSLTYSLEGTIPAGAAINPTTGEFTWTPTVGQLGPQILTVRVTDNGSPALFVEQAVAITVTPAVAGAHWINPLGGDWNVASNWSSGSVPTAADDVFIDIPGTYTIAHGVGTTQIKSLISEHPIILTGGTLEVAGVAEMNGSLITLAGGTLQNATVTGSGINGRVMDINGTGTIDGVTLQGTTSLYVPNGAALTVLNGLTLSGTSIDSGAVLDIGGGTVMLSGPHASTQVVEGTFGTVTLSGSASMITASFGVGLEFAPSMNVLVAQGTIGSLDSATANRGTIQVAGNGALEAFNLTGNYGRLQVGQNGSLAVVDTGLSMGFGNSSDGQFEAQAGSVLSFSHFFNSGRMSITGPSGVNPSVTLTLTEPDPLFNSGEIEILSDQTLELTGSLVNQPSGRVSLGQVAATGGNGRLQVSGDVTNGDSNGIFIRDGLMTVGGILTNEAEMDLGTGLVQVTGDYIQTDTGTLHTTPASLTDFGRLDISGVAILSGNFGPTVGGSFTVGDRYQFMTFAGGRQGFFTSVVIPLGFGVDDTDLNDLELVVVGG
ncbi:MAG: putative Ig domain-containing protein [Nitrospira defluvii]|nr:putative Ig domain-containing protein [Nitrospira defluvii]